MTKLATDKWRLTCGLNASQNSLTRAGEMENYQTYYFQFSPSCTIETPAQWSDHGDFNGHILAGVQGTFMGGDDHNEGSRRISGGGMGGIKQYLPFFGDTKLFAIGWLGIGGGLDWLNFGKGYPLEEKPHAYISASVLTGVEIPMNTDSAVGIGVGYFGEHGFRTENWNNHGVMAGLQFSFNIGDSDQRGIIGVNEKMLQREIIRYVDARLIIIKEQLIKSLIAELGPEIRKQVIKELEPKIRAKLEPVLRQEITIELEPELRAQITNRIIAEVKAGLVIWFNKNHPGMALKMPFNDILPKPIEISDPIEGEGNSQVSEGDIETNEENANAKPEVAKPGDGNSAVEGSIIDAYLHAYGELSILVESIKREHYVRIAERLDHDLKLALEAPLPSIVYFPHESPKLEFDGGLDQLATIIKSWIDQYIEWSKYRDDKDDIYFELPLLGFANDHLATSKNHELASSRADAVERYLLTKGGLSKEPYLSHLKIVNENRDYLGVSEDEIPKQQGPWEAKQIVRIIVYPRLKSKGTEPEEEELSYETR